MPLLHKYNISAYLSGHDHSLQHISHTNFGSTVEYFVSGANSLNSNSLANINTVPSDSLKYFWPKKNNYIDGGFLLIQTNPTSMTVNFVVTSFKTFLGMPIGGYTSRILYTKVISPRI